MFEKITAVVLEKAERGAVHEAVELTYRRAFADYEGASPFAPAHVRLAIKVDDEGVTISPTDHKDEILEEVFEHLRRGSMAGESGTVEAIRALRQAGKSLTGGGVL